MNRFSVDLTAKKADFWGLAGFGRMNSKLFLIKIRFIFAMFIISPILLRFIER